MLGLMRVRRWHSAPGMEESKEKECIFKRRKIRCERRSRPLCKSRRLLSTLVAKGPEGSFSFISIFLLSFCVLKDCLCFDGIVVMELINWLSLF
jgi:hypothetical protein